MADYAFGSNPLYEFSTGERTAWAYFLRPLKSSFAKTFREK